jgi:hypothetical protein
VVILLVLLLVGVVGGVVVYVIFEYSEVGTVFTRGEPRLDPGHDRPRVRGSLVQRLEDAPQGCLWSAIAVMALWIIAWAVVLIIGLRVLLA